MSLETSSPHFAKLSASSSDAMAQSLTFRNRLGVWLTRRHSLIKHFKREKMFAGLMEDEVQPRAVFTTSRAKCPMTILYGSNSGTCEGLSQSLARNATGHGYSATVEPLDAAIDRVPTDQPVIVLTASYEGSPPDNASGFVEWMKAAESTKFEGV